MADPQLGFAQLRAQETPFFERITQANRAAAQAGLQQQLGQQQVAAGEQDLQLGEQAVTQAQIQTGEQQEQENLRNIFRISRQAGAILGSGQPGSPEATAAFLRNSIDKRRAAGKPDAQLQDSIDLLGQIESGDIDGALININRAARTSQDLLFGQDPTAALAERKQVLAERAQSFKEREAETKRSEKDVEKDLKLTKDRFDNATKIRGEIFKASTEFDKIDSAFGRIQASVKDPSAAGDLALIFNFMKMLDPGSVVREGEFATAQNAAGVPERIRNTYQRLLTGERLSKVQRTDFIKQSDNIFKKSKEQNNEKVEKFVSIGKRFDIPREDLLGEGPEQVQDVTTLSDEQLLQMLGP